MKREEKTKPFRWHISPELVNILLDVVKCKKLFIFLLYFAGEAIVAFLCHEKRPVDILLGQLAKINENLWEVCGKSAREKINGIYNKVGDENSIYRILVALYDFVTFSHFGEQTLPLEKRRTKN